MRRATVLLFLPLWLLGMNLPARGERPAKLVAVRVRDFRDPALLQFLRSGPDVAGYDAESRSLHVLARARDLARMDSLGLEYEVQIEDLAAFESALRQSGYMEYFHDYARCKEELERAEQRFPRIARVYDLGDGWEKTQGLADRDILAIKISDKVELEEDEPEVAIVANHHAREIITPEIAVFLLNYLVERYGKDPYVTYLVDHRQIWILPTLNPDGLDYVHKVDRWWRKNRRRITDGVYGVDLNRNYGYKWGYDDIGSSGDPSSEVYRGEAPFSEPETQAFRDLCLTHHFRIVISLHSYGRLVLFPWGYVRENTPDHEVFVALADSMVRYNRYRPGNAASGAIYITNGDAGDWLYGEQIEKEKAFGFTLEVGNAFHPDTSEIRDLILENLGPVLYAIWAAGEEPIVETIPLPDTEDEVGPYVVRAKIRPAIPLTRPQNLDPEGLWLHYSVDGAPFDSVRLMPTGSRDEYAAAIPSVRGGRLYRYYISARSLEGKRGAAPRCAPDSVFQFRARPDTLPPAIEHIPLAERSVFDPACPVRATIRDASGIDSAWVEYRMDEWVIYGAEMVEVSRDQFEGSIPLAPARAWQTVWYRILAKDASRRGNVAVAPDTGWYQLRLVPDRLLDFEDSPGLVVASGGEWEWGIPTSGPKGAHSGMRVWATRLDGTYGNLADARLNTPPIDLTHARAATFRFWHWYRFEFGEGTLWDGGNLKISVDGGPFQVLETSQRGYDRVVDSYNAVLGGEPAYGGPPGTGEQWRLETFDLTPFVGHTVTLQFHFGSDHYVTDFGWYIDDVSWSVRNEGTPRVALLLQPRHTSDMEGPYLIAAEVEDDAPGVRVELVYRTDSAWLRLPMRREESWYVAEIPGQPLGTHIEYYVEARDADGNVVRDPVAAPDHAYSFWVTDDGPSPRIWPDSIRIVVPVAGAELLVDTLWIANGGLLDLIVRIRAETEGPGIGAGLVYSGREREASVCESFAGLEAIPLWSKGGIGDRSAGIRAQQENSANAVAASSESGVLVLRWPASSSARLTTWPDGEKYRLECRQERVYLASEDEQRWLVAFPAEVRAGVVQVALPEKVLGPEWSVVYLQVSESEGTALRVTRAGLDVPWLSVRPDSAVIGKGGKLPVRVIVDPRALGPAGGKGWLRIQMNLSGGKEVSVPVRVEFGTPVGVNRKARHAASRFELRPAFANPFNQGTTISFRVAERSAVELAILDGRGRVVRILWDGEAGEGEYQVHWDGKDSAGTDVPSGVYFCRMRARDRASDQLWTAGEKLLLLR